MYYILMGFHHIYIYIYIYIYHSWFGKQSVNASLIHYISSQQDTNNKKTILKMKFDLRRIIIWNDYENYQSDDYQNIHHT